ncbi:TSL-kinase interacting protein 1-like [Gossypium australe]|uniref:TSL-kinase interacting protein 1-like n=1 Tax=Gossypium australe TaxID=47621 RepID=A0A5B6U7B1_9ROSI|nr:TSL-kinase interacting protein 1-like [Gossypium australe]
MAKWCWQFAVDREALWRKIIAAKYGTPMQHWHFRSNNLKDMSVVWRGIVENAKDSKVAKWMGNESFRWLVGNGNLIIFWEDIWCGDRPLRVEFPRLFRLALNKSGLVKEFLSLNGFKEINWAEFFSRSLLDREIIMVSRLKEVVSCLVLIPKEEDRLIWIHDKKGVFSVRKLTKLLISVDVADCRFAFDRIWKLKVPPKAKRSLWVVSIDRTPTKEFLSRRGVKFGQSGNGCPWCERELETSVHLFFHCNFIVGFWRIILEWSEELFLWLISVSAACWSVWLARNKLVLVYDELKVIERIWWVCPVRSWRDVKKFGSSGRFWCPPCFFGWVKFNVSGVVIEGEVGCGGVLRNSEGVVRAVFSGPCVARDSLVAEVGAISFALERWGRRVVALLLSRLGLQRLSSIGYVSFSRVDKQGNVMALALPVAGLKRQGWVGIVSAVEQADGEVRTQINCQGLELGRVNFKHS